MVKSVDCSDFRSSSTATEFQQISFTIQCSAPKSKWAAKWSLVSKLGKPSAVSASLRAKLPRMVFKLSLAVKSTVSKGGPTPSVGKTVKLFGLFKARKVCWRWSWCLQKLKSKAFLQTGSNSGTGGLSNGGVDSVQNRKSVELERKGEQREVAFDKSASDLGTWVSRNYWEGQLKGLLRWLGNPSLPFRFFASDEKGRGAMIVRAGVVLFTLMLLLSQLGIAGAVLSAPFLAYASVAVVESVLNFFCDNNSKKLRTALWKVWVEPVSFGGITISPQVMCSTVEPFIRGRMLSGMLVGTSALSTIILFSTLRQGS